MSKDSTIEISSIGGALTITPMRAMMRGSQAWSIGRTAIETITLDRHGEAYSVTLHLTDGRGFVVRGVSTADAGKLAQAFGVPMDLPPAEGPVNSGVTAGPATRPLPRVPAYQDTYEPYPHASSPAEGAAEDSLPDHALSLGAELVAACMQGRFIITTDHVGLLGTTGWLEPRREVAGVMPRRGSFGCDLAVVLHSGMTHWLGGLAYPDAVGAIELLGMGGGMQLGEPAAPTWPDERHRTPSLSSLPELPDMWPPIADAVPAQSLLPPLAAFARQAPDTSGMASAPPAPTRPFVEQADDIAGIAPEQPVRQRDDAGALRPPMPEVAPSMAAAAPPDAPIPPGAETSGPPEMGGRAVPLPIAPPADAGADAAIAEPETHFPPPAIEPVSDDATETAAEESDAAPASISAAPQIPEGEEAPPEPTGDPPTDTPAEPDIELDAGLGTDAPSEVAPEPTTAPAETPVVTDPGETVERDTAATSAPADRSEGEMGSPSPMSPRSIVLARTMPVASAAERELPALAVATAEKSGIWAGGPGPRRRGYASMAAGAVMLMAMLILATKNLQPIPQVHLRTDRSRAVIKHATSPTATPMPTTAQPDVPGTGLAALLAGSHDGTVYALSPRDGSFLWQYRTGGIMESAPTLAGNTVFVGSDDHSIYALNLNSHALLWRAHVGGNVTTPPAVAGGIVFVGGSDGYLYALDAAKGTTRWHFKAGSWFAGQPAASGGGVYAGSYDGNLYALRATDGAMRWRYHTGGSVASSPAVVGGTVYAGSNDGAVYAFDATSGNLRWRYQTGGSVYSSPMVTNDTVYVGSFDGFIYALRARDGMRLWRHQTGGLVSSSPAVVDDTVYVGSADNSIYALRTQDGAQIWAFKTGGAVSSSPVVAKGAVYVGSSDHTMYALSVANGSLLWSQRTHDTVNWRPAIVP